MEQSQLYKTDLAREFANGLSSSTSRDLDSLMFDGEISTERDMVLKNVSVSEKELASINRALSEAASVWLKQFKQSGLGEIYAMSIGVIESITITNVFNEIYNAYGKTMPGITSLQIKYRVNFLLGLRSKQ